ncbi:MAG: methylenetetrahydrofolate reductase C-terminal domain-containing protein [Planctomycetia bacterium]|nr:methylenetetrahydrofolate reductase C-terminal domain-containing protein [Planctomycetia bacterium]
MIILKQKVFESILEKLAGEKKIFLAGCADCAAACKVGGEEDLEIMKNKLQEAGITITGACVFDTMCQSGEVRQRMKEHASEIDQADSILALACGTGAQTIGDTDESKQVHIGVESLFIGQVDRLGKYTEKCSVCGDCILEMTDGICPVTRCAKGLINGPCGGYSKDGKCEVDPEKDCAWVLIYKRLAARGHLDKLKEMVSPRDHSLRHTPRSLKWEMKKPAKK